MIRAVTSTCRLLYIVILMFSVYNLLMSVHNHLMCILLHILIWWFGESLHDSPSLYMQAWVSFYTVIKIANLKSRQQHFLSKLPNIIFANISAYTVLFATTMTHITVVYQFMSNYNLCMENKFV